MESMQKFIRLIFITTQMRINYISTLHNFI